MRDWKRWWYTIPSSHHVDKEEDLWSIETGDEALRT